GPASSQLGFAIGLQRAGLPGAIAAFIGFTLPSFLLMTLLALGYRDLATWSAVAGLWHGLKLFALVIVADALLALFRQFCRDRSQQAICFLVASLLWIFPGNLQQLLLLTLVGLWSAWRNRDAHQAIPESTNPPPLSSLTLARWPLLLFLLLLSLPLLPLVGLPLSGLGQLFSHFYQTGTLVFGGGHVVLPLLQQGAAASLPSEQFLSGYAAAQLVPGPMFSLAAYLGALLAPATPWLGSLVATLGLFLPGFLLILVFLPVWHSLLQRPRVLQWVASINAAVVGLLLATLYHPLFTSAVAKPADLAWVLLGWWGLRQFRPPIWLLALGFVTLGLLFHYL
ncbi:MAG: chromate efflux transporter, partial [Aeromonadaceae bacterium]